MFSGGDYAEVERWVQNFVISHAKREVLAAEAVIESDGPREGKSYGIRLCLGDRIVPPPPHPPLEVDYTEAARERGSLAWCLALADRIRALARELVSADREARTPA
jgi:hypothetical protein